MTTTPGWCDVHRIEFAAVDHRGAMAAIVLGDDVPVAVHEARVQAIAKGYPEDRIWTAPFVVRTIPKRDWSWDSEWGVVTGTLRRLL